MATVARVTRAGGRLELDGRPARVGDALTLGARLHAREGMSPKTLALAEMWAKLGYVAFAADIYGKGVRPKDHEEAGKVAGNTGAEITVLHVVPPNRDSQARASGSSAMATRRR